jgi:DeoR family suf operon transcriptional repressor
MTFLPIAPGDEQNLAGAPPGYRGLRGEILLELKRATSGLTAGELGERLHASLNAVRHHLKEFESESLIERRREQRGIGAPVHVYLLSSSGEDLFPRRYEALLTQVLSRMVEHNGRPVVLEAMEEHYAELARGLQSELSGASGHERLRKVAELLGNEGYMTEWGEADGVVSLTEHNCAIKAVAQQFPEICEAEAKFLRSVLSAGVERRSHILTGCHCCEYSIRFPEEVTDSSPVLNPVSPRTAEPEGGDPTPVAV